MGLRHWGTCGHRAALRGLLGDRQQAGELARACTPAGNQLVFSCFISFFKLNVMDRAVIAGSHLFGF